MMGSGGATNKTNMMSATPGLEFMEATATRKGDDSKKDGRDNHMRSSTMSKKS